MNDDDALTLPCRVCERSTRHRLLAEDASSSPSSEGAGHLWDTYEIARCEGCGTVCFHHSRVITATGDVHSEVLGTHSHVYPQSKASRKPIPGSEVLPEVTRQVYIEVLGALDAGLSLLAAMGLRTVVESVCRDRADGFRTLHEGIARLGMNGIISLDQEQYLHAQRFLGNEATHLFVAPPVADLAVALEITETMLKTIYVLPHLADRLAHSRRPPARV